MSASGPEKSESELIRRLRQELRPAGAPGPPRPPGLPQDFVDDMAGLAGAAEPLLWTVDMLMDGVDFESTRHGWAEIGRKAMAVNLSDCAAMAVRPLSALLAVALHNALALDDAVRLARGAHEFGLRYGCPLVGGDTNSWDHPTVISITIAARPEPGRAPVRRDGARPGDAVYVTGPLGGSRLGRHMTFEPRIETALAINRALSPTAMIDVSDGLALDLWRILEASGCGAVLEAAALDQVLHPDALVLAARDGRPPRAHALFDGEDFELIVTVPPAVPEPRCRALGLRPLGRLQAEPGLFLREGDDTCVPIPRRGWEHFR
jgi:thiamine-monophosphate kinase